MEGVEGSGSCMGRDGWSAGLMAGRVGCPAARGARLWKDAAEGKLLGVVASAADVERRSSLPACKQGRPLKNRKCIPLPLRKLDILLKHNKNK